MDIDNLNGYNVNGTGFQTRSPVNSDFDSDASPSSDQTARRLNQVAARLFTGSLDRSGQTVSDEDIPELDLNFNGLNLLDDGIEATSQYTCSQEALFLSDEEEDLLPSSKRQRSVETNDSFGSPLNSNPIPVQS